MTSGGLGGGKSYEVAVECFNYLFNYLKANLTLGTYLKKYLLSQTLEELTVKLMTLFISSSDSRQWLYCFIISKA